jgi:hypothetical protein
VSARFAYRDLTPFSTPPRGLRRLLCPHPIGNSRATGKRVIPERRLPIVRHGELRTIQKLGVIQERSVEIGAIEYSFEEVRAFEMGT